jgi:glycosyltransferase involved in cell wall biosynthesis
MKISIIQPSRNNLKYLKWSYNSIRNNQGNHTVQICVADDFSSDGTWDWCLQKMEEDRNFSAIRNEGPERLGHTILYDRLVSKVAKHDYCIIYHADMYLAPKALDAIEKHIKRGTIVSLTRVEPTGLHPEGPEKILKDFGDEPSNFAESRFLTWFENYNKDTTNTKVTDGIFAPWAFHRKDFLEIGGHDDLFAPQSKEDSDIFNRFMLNGIDFIQTWEGLVYHLTCRGSRFNTTITKVGTNSDEWIHQNIKSARNFIRKWGHYVEHTPLMKPIVPPKYNIVIKLLNCKRYEGLANIEPWGDVVYTDFTDYRKYVEEEQSNTLYAMETRVKSLDDYERGNVVVTIDFDKFTDAERYGLNELPKIIANSNELGEFSLGSMKVEIYDLKTFEHTLITNNL